MPTREFDVEIEVRVDIASLDWPERGDAGEDSGLGCNRHYADFRGVGWRAVAAMISAEKGFVDRVSSARNMAAECSALNEELFEEEEQNGYHSLWGLDLGVASAVLALSAARCIPFSSCNAGAFREGHHAEGYPLVAFFVRPQMATIIIDCANKVGVGLRQDQHGVVHVYGRRVEDLLAFAGAIYDARRQISAVKFSKRLRLSSALHPRLL